MVERSKARVCRRSLAGIVVSNPAGGMISVSCECCVLSGSGLCDEPITRPEESYRPWCVIVRHPETSKMRWPWPALGCCAREKRSVNSTYQLTRPTVHEQKNESKPQLSPTVTLNQ
jgi:hypothetical protein